MANGLLGGNFLTDLGLGLLSQSGPVVGPAPSLGQALGRAGLLAQERRRERLKNDLIRQKMTQQQEQQNALGKIQGLLGKNTTIQGTGTDVQGLNGQNLGTIPGKEAMVSTIQTPEGKQKLLGLLSQAAPDQFAQNLISQIMPGQQRAEPTQVRIARTLSDPNESQSVKDEIRKQLQAKSSGQQLDILNARLKTLEIQSQLNDLEQKKQTETKDKADLKSSLITDLNHAKRLSELNHKLENTALETGIPLAQLRRDALSGTSALKRAFGGDAEKAQQLINDFDEFSKISVRFAAKSAAQLFKQQRITNFQFKAIQNATPSVGLAPGANDRVIADSVRVLLEGAKNANINIPNTSSFDQLINQLQGNASEQGGKKIDLPSDIKQLPPDLIPAKRKSNQKVIDLGDGATLEIQG